MGATFPLAMAAIRRGVPDASPRSFSYLYVANVVGACAGTLVSALVLIEIFGFRGTLLLAAALNAALAAGALALSLLPTRAAAAPTEVSVEAAPSGSRGTVLSALFATGFSSMGMEVVWVRQFTPYLGTLVYAFAVILALYLAATFTGSTLCRWRRLPEPSGGSAIT